MRRTLGRLCGGDLPHRRVTPAHTVATLLSTRSHAWATTCAFVVEARDDNERSPNPPATRREGLCAARPTAAAIPRSLTCSCSVSYWISTTSA